MSRHLYFFKKAKTERKNQYVIHQLKEGSDQKSPCKKYM